MKKPAFNLLDSQVLVDMGMLLPFQRKFYDAVARGDKLPMLFSRRGPQANHDVSIMVAGHVARAERQQVQIIMDDDANGPEPQREIDKSV